MKKIIFISYHYFNSQRKAGFHWLAGSFAKKKNWDVLFVTAPINLLSWISGDHRFKYPIFEERNKVIDVIENVQSYVYLTSILPFSIKTKEAGRLLNFFIGFCEYLYQKIMPSSLKSEIKDADVIVFESTDALLLFGKVCELNPSSKKIYRVSDDLKLLGTPRSIIDYESKIAPFFDLISVPSEYIFNKFNYLPNCRLQYHGIDKALFDNNFSIPDEYHRFVKNFVFIGISYLDEEFIQLAALVNLNWGFHIIGPFEKIRGASNILYYGEMPYHKIVPYIKHADAGLHTLIKSPGLASFSDSLKVLQYSFCKLPIIAPIGLNSSRNNMIYYIPGDRQSIEDALIRAVNYDRSGIDTSNIHSWDELADLMLEEIY